MEGILDKESHTTRHSKPSAHQLSGSTKKKAPAAPKTVPSAVSKNDKLEVSRPCAEHNFLTDVSTFP